MNGRPVHESVSEYLELAMPNDANPLGTLFGGKVMQLVDLAASLAAARHARMPVVTAAIDHLDFIHPAHIGQLLVLRSSVNRVFRTSMEVGVRVAVEDLRTRDLKHIASAYLTFVALGEDGKPAALPAVIPETTDELRRYERAGMRRQHRLETRQR